MHNNIKIEFFHDVICSFCFPMSYRMRQLQNLMPDLSIEHRSFALVRDTEDFDVMFGSRESAKEDILSHWDTANQNDDLHRFNISGMRNTDFPFPSSMKVLTAAKAAWFVSGDAGYWDVFDSLQNALFVKNQNIELDDVIESCVKETAVDFEQWSLHFDAPETLKAVENDLVLAENYGINSVPCLIVNGQYKISGAQPLSQIIQVIKELESEFKDITESKKQPEGAACSMENGKFHCD